jgi:PhzF family phenazine biosynthesis protein
MSEITAYKVNSFTDNERGGNGAGVVLSADSLTSDQMQRVGSLVGYSETAFVSQSPDADFRFRFFSPTTEVDLCGHASIAACLVLAKEHQLTKSAFSVAINVGELAITTQPDGKILLRLAEPTLCEELDISTVAAILGIDESAIASTNLKPQVVSIGTRELIVPVASKDVLDKFQPDLKAMTDFSIAHDTMGMHVFTQEEIPDTADAACRNFDPKDGIDEESATGGACAALGYYLTRHNSQQRTYTFLQGLNMPNPSKLYVAVDSDGTVQVGGHAVITSEEHYSI